MPMRYQTLILLAVASVMLVGCQPEVEPEDLGELIYHIPDVPDAEKRIVIKPSAPDTSAKGRSKAPEPARRQSSEPARRQSSEPARRQSSKSARRGKSPDAAGNKGPARAVPAQKATAPAATVEEPQDEGQPR